MAENGQRAVVGRSRTQLNLRDNFCSTAQSNRVISRSSQVPPAVEPAPLPPCRSNQTPLVKGLLLHLVVHERLPRHWCTPSNVCWPGSVIFCPRCPDVNSRFTNLLHGTMAVPELTHPRPISAIFADSRKTRDRLSRSIW